MTLLHDYFNTRNLQGFQRLLDGSNERGTTASSPSAATGAPGSSSLGGGGGKSWTRTGGSANNSLNQTVDVNVKDWLGRTVLHLAAISTDYIEYARALLKHPNIDVNLPDTESMWTPLHRALYNANFPVALLLLQRSDINASSKDIEGYTAYDVYNSTINGTKPTGDEFNAELFTWGVNRNAALGLSDGDDRVYPDHVVIKSKEDPNVLLKLSLAARFSPIHVHQIQMSRLHTAVITSENEGNLRLCGFGSGGRLGPAQHTQYSLNPLSSFNLQVVRVALGQDHTLALTSSGEVYSWGLNRFSQLGYVVELPGSSMGRHEEPIQTIPKRVVGPLRREVIIGVAASKNASACWSKETVYTWGTNTGQLGYDKNAQPIQVLPRHVTRFSNTVIDLAMSDTVLVGLLVTHHVECIWNDKQTRIMFPINAFPTGIEPYRPPHSIRDSCISKVVCCDETFAALSSNGEVFTFSAPSAEGGESRGFKPQRVWALKKKFSSVKDLALGADGSLIVCTESGHVFVRSRNTKSSTGKAFKFERIPFLQRVTGVCANNTGAFGALKINHVPKPIEVIGNTIAQDLKTVQPYLTLYGDTDKSTTKIRSFMPNDSTAFDDEPEDAGIESDINDLLALCNVLVSEQKDIGSFNYNREHLPNGADTLIHVQSNAVFPAHRAILAARSSVLERLLVGSKSINDPKTNINVKILPARPGPGIGVFITSHLRMTGCHSLSVLILLRYLYSDEVLAIWDRRVNTAVDKELVMLHANPARIKVELQGFAQLLDLSELKTALDPPVKREPIPTMVQDMKKVFNIVQIGLPTTSPLSPDVVLVLQDKEILCHSVVLRARSPFFASFFDLEDWTMKRWDADGKIRINMKHLRWHVMRFVLDFMCCGEDVEMFKTLEFVNSVDDLLQFMFEVLAAANELLLDRLILLCSAVILAYANITNACYILADATHYHVLPLIEKMQEYVTVNMETFLENCLLDDIPYALVKQLAKFVKQRQIEKSPFSRGQIHIDYVMEKNADWLATQDVPETIIDSFLRYGPIYRKDISGNAKLSPMKRAIQKTNTINLPRTSPAASMLTTPMLRRPPSGDDIFWMDEPDAPGPSSLNSELAPVFNMPSVASPAWKAHGAPRVDMKALIAAEAANQTQASTSRPSLSTRAPSFLPRISGVTTHLSTPTKIPSKSGVPTGWRTIDHPPVNPSFLAGTPPASSGASASAPKDSGRPSPSSTRTQLPQQPQPQQSQSQLPGTPSRSQVPGLGPVITPTRMAPSKASGRVPSGGKVWNQAPVNLISSPTTAIPAKGMSFVAIQHSQQEQAAPVKDKRSIREIQEEEQALQVEADFLKWWTAEEERIQREELASMTLIAKLQENQANVSGDKSHGIPRVMKTKKQRQLRDKPLAVGRSGPQGSESTQQPSQSSSTSDGPYHSKRKKAHQPLGHRQKNNATS